MSDIVKTKKKSDMSDMKLTFMAEDLRKTKIMKEKEVPSGIVYKVALQIQGVGNQYVRGRLF